MNLDCPEFAPDHTRRGEGKTMDHEIHELHEIHEKREKLLYGAEVYAIQGVIFEVYREMGCGFLEAVYQECREGLSIWSDRPCKDWMCSVSGWQWHWRFRRPAGTRVARAPEFPAVNCRAIVGTSPRDWI